MNNKRKININFYLYNSSLSFTIGQLHFGRIYEEMNFRTESKQFLCLVVSVIRISKSRDYV